MLPSQHQQQIKFLFLSSNQRRGALIRIIRDLLPKKTSNTNHDDPMEAAARERIINPIIQSFRVRSRNFSSPYRPARCNKAFNWFLCETPDTMLITFKLNNSPLIRPGKNIKIFKKQKGYPRGCPTGSRERERRMSLTCWARTYFGALIPNKVRSYICPTVADDVFIIKLSSFFAFFFLSRLNYFAAYAFNLRLALEFLQPNT